MPTPQHLYRRKTTCGLELLLNLISYSGATLYFTMNCIFPTFRAFGLKRLRTLDQPAPKGKVTIPIYQQRQGTHHPVQPQSNR